MASQVCMEGFKANMSAVNSLGPKDIPVMSIRANSNSLERVSPTAEKSTGEAASPHVLSHAVEFVALPGEAERLRAAIPMAMRDANGNSAGFAGYLVLFCEQEERLVTVITLWTGADRAKVCNENSKRLERLLEPHVDRWLRIRRFVTFLSVP